MHQHARQPLRWERRIRSEAPLVRRHGNAGAVPRLRQRLACRSGAARRARRAVRLAADGDRLLHLRRRPSRGRIGRVARRAVRHAHPHHLGDRHRGVADRCGHARRRHRPDAGARHHVRRHHDHDERHGRPLPAMGRLAARAAGIQPRRGARLSGSPHSAFRHCPDLAERHRLDGAGRARSTSGRRSCSP